MKKSMSSGIRKAESRKQKVTKKRCHFEIRCGRLTAVAREARHELKNELRRDRLTAVARGAQRGEELCLVLL